MVKLHFPIDFCPLPRSLLSTGSLRKHQGANCYRHFLIVQISIGIFFTSSLHILVDPDIDFLTMQTLAFMEPSDKGDVGDVSRSRASIQSTTRSSRNNNHQYHNAMSSSGGSGSTKFGKNYQPVEGKLYEFDGVFDESAMQDEVYEKTAAPLVRSVLEGFYATVFAYGATGSV